MSSSTASAFRLASPLPSSSGVSRRRRGGTVSVRCGIGDLIGGDLVKPDLGRWLDDVEKHKALAIYSPHEGGYEGRYLNRLRYQGYRFLDMSARGLGDPETMLTKIYPVCPIGECVVAFAFNGKPFQEEHECIVVRLQSFEAPNNLWGHYIVLCESNLGLNNPPEQDPHVGKQPIARWYFPPEVDFRLAMLPPDAKGLVLWIIEAKVLSKAELQFLALLPSLQPKVRVIAECGNWRKFIWKPLKEISGLVPLEE